MVTILARISFPDAIAENLTHVIPIDVKGRRRIYQNLILVALYLLATTSITFAVTTNPLVLISATLVRWYNFISFLYLNTFSASCLVPQFSRFPYFSNTTQTVIARIHRTYVIPNSFSSIDRESLSRSLNIVMLLGTVVSAFTALLITALLITVLLITALLGSLGVRNSSADIWVEGEARTAVPSFPLRLHFIFQSTLEHSDCCGWTEYASLLLHIRWCVEQPSMRLLHLRFPPLCPSWGYMWWVPPPGVESCEQFILHFH